MFEINNLSVSIDKTVVVSSVSFKVGSGQVIAIMGPNGAGKSSVAKAVAGHPDFSPSDGSIYLDGVDITHIEPDEKAKNGLFVSCQYPPEIAGLNMNTFLYESYKSIHGEKLDWDCYISEISAELEFPSILLQRDMNVGFSGGQKKKSEILQMISVNPKVAILDEVDSGLDICAMQVAAKALNKYIINGGCLIIITHYLEFLSFFDIDSAIVIVDGAVKASGSKAMLEAIKEHGYDC